MLSFQGGEKKEHECAPKGAGKADVAKNGKGKSEKRLPENQNPKEERNSRGGEGEGGKMYKLNFRGGGREEWTIERSHGGRAEKKIVPQKKETLAFYPRGERGIRSEGRGREKKRDQIIVLNVRVNWFSLQGREGGKTWLSDV